MLSRPGALVSGWTSAILCFSAASGFWLAGETRKSDGLDCDRDSRSVGYGFVKPAYVAASKVLIAVRRMFVIITAEQHANVINSG